MILQRQGNKRLIAEKIIAHFPEHEIYIEPFFGAGGLFFNKPLAKYNIVNDLDDDVFNLFMVLMNQRQELVELVEQTPIHESLLRHWKRNKETDPLLKAMRFLFLSNYSMYAGGESLRFDVTNTKSILISKIKRLNGKLKDVVFSCKDYKAFLESLNSRAISNKTLVYCDPPYIGTDANYKGFKQDDFLEMIELLMSKSWNFAISEFDSEFIRKVAKDNNLNVYLIGERRNIHNRRVEVLMTNYKANHRLF